MKKLNLAAVAALGMVSFSQFSSGAAIFTHLPITDVTPNSSVLNNTLFLDAASIGGGDTNLSTVAQSTNRNLDLNGAAGASGTAGTLTITGLAFSTGANVNSPQATTITATFTYLGLNGVVGGGDDVVIGSSNAIAFADATTGDGLGYEGAGRYLVNFDTSPSALIDGANEVFQLTLTPVGGNQRFKTTAGTAISAAKFSIAGTYVVVPEPTTLGGIAALGTFLARRRRT